MEKNDLVKDISIIDYLEKRGFKFKAAGGGKHFCSSPFSRDTNWSFCVYPTNTYFDWSTGHGGNIISLHSRLMGLSFSDAINDLTANNTYEKYKPNYKQYKQSKDFFKDFDYKKYINTNATEVEEIQTYAASRRITSGYLPGVFFTREQDKKGHEWWVRNPSMMFLHQDENGNICGAKFRKIRNQTPKDQSPRFSARGSLELYVLENHNLLGPKKTNLYFVESETSANALWSFLKDRGVSAVVASSGGVSSPPKRLPERYKDLPVKLIIDYDGDEELYQKRLRLYKHLNAQPIKMILPKGEDINSLYCQDKMYLIEHLLLK